MGTLRFILALSVAMAHGWATLFGVPLIEATGAVWLFFVISGFLITLALTGKYTLDAVGLRHFYWNRAIRLFPGYWAWLAIIFSLQFALPDMFVSATPTVESLRTVGFWERHVSTAEPVTLLIAGLANLTGFLSDGLLRTLYDPLTGLLVAHTTPTTPALWGYSFVAVGQIWTIGVEISFYLLAPFVVRRLWLVAILFAASASGYLTDGWQVAMSAIGAPPYLIFLQIPTWLWMFMLGATLAHLYVRNRDGAKRAAVVLAALYVAMIAYIMSRGTGLFPVVAFPWWLFAAIATAAPLLFHFTNRSKIDRFIGDLSYPIYINHFMVITALRYFGGQPAGYTIAFWSISLAILTVLLVEQPTRAWKWRRKPPLRSEQPAMISTG